MKSQGSIAHIGKLIMFIFEYPQDGIADFIVIGICIVKFEWKTYRGLRSQFAALLFFWKGWNTWLNVYDFFLNIKICYIIEI